MRANPRDRPGTPGGGRGSLSPRVAVGRGTRTRRTRPRAPARRGGKGNGGAESLRAPVRPPAAVEGGGAPHTGAARSSPPSHNRCRSSSTPGRTAPPIPRRTCAAETERNKLCATARRKEKKPSRNCVRTRVLRRRSI